jgi:hypothetical protein
VICPPAELLAELGLDRDQRIDTCSRWPERAGCNQTCGPQVQFSAGDLSDFAAQCEGKNCSLCGAVLTRDDWYKSRLSALDANAVKADSPGTAVPLLPGDPDHRDPICAECYAARVGSY